MINDNSIDAIVANYVLMDTPNLQDALNAFFRVLKPGGHAVIAFLHPCFPLQSVTYDSSSQHTEFHWDESYFSQRMVQVPPWTDVFSSNFLVFHRPISVYFKEFRQAGFNVIDMVEPVIEEGYTELPEELVKLFRMEPISIIFMLQKP